jgi:hypothetical protein
MIMKKILSTAAVAALCFSACSTDDPTANLTARIKTDTTEMKHVTITFNCRGDFDLTTESFTRALTADGKAMTDLWVLDYPNGATQPSAVIHQTSDDEDFGSPTLNLAVGSHHVYFIASRGQDATIDTDAHTIAFARVLDTFYYDLALDVTATSSGSRNVTLERCVTKFTAVITDAIPEDAATFNITPAQWYYGWDYVAGTPTAATASQTITINIPSSEIGATNERLSIFGFSAATEWMADIAINCKKGDETILGTAAISDVPLKQKRITTFSGPLFSANGLTTVSLSSDWLDEHTGTW